MAYPWEQCSLVGVSFKRSHDQPIMTVGRKEENNRYTDRGHATSGFRRFRDRDWSYIVLQLALTIRIKPIVF